MKRLFKIILMLGLISSCAKEYDISNDNLDTAITVGGDSLTIPIGETDSIFLTDYLDLNSIEMLKVDDDGNYYLEFSQEVNGNVAMTDIIGNISIDTIKNTFRMRFAMPEEYSSASSGTLTQSQTEPLSLSFEFNKEYELPYSFEEAKEFGLMEIDSIIMKSAFVDVDMSVLIDGIENFDNPMEVELTFSYPKSYSIITDEEPVRDPMREDNDMITLRSIWNKTARNVRFPSIEIRKIAFDVNENDSFEFDDFFYIRTIILKINPSDIQYILGSTEVVFDGEVVINPQDSDSGNDKLYIKSLYGLLDYQTDPVSQSVSFSSMPDFMKDEDIVLDFYNPYLKLEMNTNLGIPMKIEVALESEFDNRDDNGKTINLTLDTPASDNPDESANKNYWISSREPSDLEPGYEWKNADIASLIRRIPDLLNVKFASHTDLSKGNHYVDFDADYSVDGLFSFIVPFSFGDELHLPMSTTINNVPTILTDILSSTNVTLSGEVESMFPVKVKIDFLFLDERGEELDVNVEPQIIESIEQPGVPVKMPLNLAVTSSKLDSDISAAVLKLTLLPGKHPGIPLSEDAFLRAKLSVSVPGGITIDMDDLPDNNNDNNDNNEMK